MRVVFLRSVPNVARAGDVKEVSDGFARNLLLPRGDAVAATPERLQELKASAQRREKQVVAMTKDTEKTIRRLQGRSFTLKRKASDHGTLFAGVTAAVISDILRQDGSVVEASMIHLAEPLKALGQYRIRIGHGAVEATIHLTIVQP